MKRAVAIAVVLLGLLPLGAWAHGDAHEIIAALTARIAKEPGNAELYLQRGEAHRVHRDWDAALADYEQAQKLDPKIPVLDLLRGKLFLEAGWPLSAKAVLDRFLAGQPNHVEGLTTRARVQVKLGQRLAAARDFTAAINASTKPEPELYLERAQTLKDEGGPHLDEALRGLEEGIKRLGPVITLELYALDVELKEKRVDAALARLEKIARQYPRQETWLARRGEILQQAGRPREAAEAYRASLAAMSKLPPARRSVPAMQELEKRVQAALAEIAGANARK